MWIVIVIIILGFLGYASFSIRSGIYLKAWCKNPAKGRFVALTFDDGPDPVRTPRILDILKEHRIKAGFFVIGKQVAANREIVRRMAEEGHLIGNHSFRHTSLFPFYSAKRMVAELEACAKSIEASTVPEAGIGNPGTGNNEKVRYFRPPFGVTNPPLAKAVKRLGYITIGWSIRSLDTLGNEKKALDRVKRRLHPGAILLLHDTMPFSDSLLQKILQALDASNYQVERPDHLLNIKNNQP